MSEFGFECCMHKKVGSSRDNECFLACLIPKSKYVDRTRISSGTMSLFKPAGGILRTNLSWDDLQESVFETFGKDAKFGPSKDAKDIGFASGFMSKICLITPDWQGRMDGVPEKFVVKVSSQLSFIECKGMFGDIEEEFSTEEFSRAMESEVKKIHNNEITLYKLLEKYDVSEVPRPKKSIEVYYTREFSEENPLKGFIIMEYLADNLSLHIFDNLSPEDILQALHAIASLEAASLKFTDEDKGLFMKNIFGEMFAKALTKETSHFGCPTTDVVRLLNACLSAKDRRENWESLLEKFYSFLKDEVGNNNQMPCTLEQLKQAYRLYFPLGAFMIVPMIGPLFSLANNSDDVEYKERVQELIFEKTEGLLEDIFEFYEKNKNTSSGTEAKESNGGLPL
ncbi:hypothetical protein ANCCEY_14632 [Ancylostoma ceylanicum]|uniref:CHK kinase-like domain-containing protein n=1 Tax=Ancylostoma ceylanicum TaxID=53326 RepID=A0A0D6LF65_9BILA|nr:hypothetical protein ANCCEY_14632 [Ancylostoma ceylanicum]